VISERDDRRNYRPAWPRVVPAVVEIPIRGLLTGHEYITRFIDTAWRAPCSPTPQLQ
jgi:hypothetical protein